jgi:predicted esterase
MFSQEFDIRIPEEDAAKIKEVSLVHSGETFDFKLVYPVEYDSTKQHDVVLGLSGGNAAPNLVDYCYYSMFKTKYFDDKFIIMPIGFNGQPLHKLESETMVNMLDAVLNEFNINNKNWLLVGTSNGGVAAFRFAYVRPELFKGIIVIPGAMSFDEVHEKWSDYRIMLCCGENDDESWLNAVKRDRKLLTDKVKEVFTYIIKDEGHILSPTYNQELIYDLYFSRE